MAIGSIAGIIVGVVSAVASAVTSAVSANQQAKAQQKAADYNKKVAENNSKMAQMQAGFDARRLRDRNRRLAAKQRAGLAKSGVSITSGSAFDVLADQEVLGELDALTTLHRGTVQSTGYQGQAQYQRFVGSSAAAQGRTAVAGSLLAGAANTGSAVAQGIVQMET